MRNNAHKIFLGNQRTNPVIFCLVIKTFDNLFSRNNEFQTRKQVFIANMLCNKLYFK
jgi:hypothetical protein